MRGLPGRRRGPPRFYPNLDAFPLPPRRPRAEHALITPESGHDDRISPPPPSSVPLLALSPSSPPPSVPLFVRASPNRNSFRPEVSVAHELRRYVVSPTSRHLLFLPLFLPRPIQLPGIRPRSSPPPGVAPSLRRAAHQKINRVLLVRPRRPAMGAQEGRGERENRGMSGRRTNRVIALVLTAAVQEATVVVIRVGRARERLLPTTYCKFVSRVS